MKSFRNLEVLGITRAADPHNQNMFSTNDEIFQNVKELKISYVWQINQGHAEEIAHNFPKLEKLTVQTTDRMEDGCTEIFLRELMQLKNFESRDDGKVRKSRGIIGCIKEYGKNLESFCDILIL